MQLYINKINGYKDLLFKNGDFLSATKTASRVIITTQINPYIPKYTDTHKYTRPNRFLIQPVLQNWPRLYPAKGCHFGDIIRFESISSRLILLSLEQHLSAGWFVSSWFLLALSPTRYRRNFSAAFASEGFIWTPPRPHNKEWTSVIWVLVANALLQQPPLRQCKQHLECVLRHHSHWWNIGP